MVVIKNSGAVACGHCTCMAGLGETCSHVGALLYWLEYSIQKREEQSCTSGPNQWLEPKSIKQVPYMELGSIDFTSANRSMKKFHQSLGAYAPLISMVPHVIIAGYLTLTIL